MTHFSNQPRAALDESQSRFRAAGEMVLSFMRDDKLTPTDCKLWTWITTHMATWTRLRDRVTVDEIVKATGAARASISRALKHLTELGVIHWSPDSQKGSFLSLRELLAPAGNVSPRCDTSMSHLDDAPLTSSSYKKKEERESAPSSLPADAFVPEIVQTTIPAHDEKVQHELSDRTPLAGQEENGSAGWHEPWGYLACDSASVRILSPETGPALPVVSEIVDDPSMGTGGSLTPDETHEEDARFAASALAMHLFQRVPDRRTCMSIYRRFVSLPTGMTTLVLNVALLGRPARTIDYPAGYAAEWIRNAADRVMQPAAA